MSVNSERTEVDFVMPALPPRPGEVWLSVELTAIHDRPLSEVMETLFKMGYQPELRYRQMADQVALFALLRHEQHDFLEEDYLVEEWEQLAATLPPHAISSPRNYGKRAIAA